MSISLTEADNARRILIARITKAISIAPDGADGEHHKTWVIDQMIRALTGCPVITKNAKDCCGADYSYEAQGESEEYLQFTKDNEPWDEGIAP
jgi:hypothetical protein